MCKTVLNEVFYSFNDFIPDGFTGFVTNSPAGWDAFQYSCLTEFDFFMLS